MESRSPSSPSRSLASPATKTLAAAPLADTQYPSSPAPHASPASHSAAADHAPPLHICPPRPHTRTPDRLLVALPPAPALCPPPPPNAPRFLPPVAKDSPRCNKSPALDCAR